MAFNLSFFEKDWNSVKLTLLDFGRVTLRVECFDVNIPKVFLVLIPKALPARKNMTDNILITQSMVHSMMNMCDQSGAMILKIHLQKANDNVN